MPAAPGTRATEGGEAREPKRLKSVRGRAKPKGLGFSSVAECQPSKRKGPEFNPQHPPKYMHLLV